jgi:ABC-type glycerol-3-phosphate transport system substrate-binding protein
LTLEGESGLNTRLWQKICSGILAFVLLFYVQSSLTARTVNKPVKEAVSGAGQASPTSSSAPSGPDTELTYAQALSAWNDKGIGSAGSVVAVSTGVPQAVSNTSRLTTGEYKGKSSVLRWESPNKEWVEYKVEVPVEGLYEIRVSYRPIVGDSGTSPILWEVELDGKRPFAEASSVALYRTWQDARPILTNSDGDQIRPRSTDISDWSMRPLLDSAGAYAGPLQWHFTKGSHTIRFSGYEPVAIERIELAPSESVGSYAEVSAAYPEAPGNGVEGITLQAEDFAYKNDTAIKLFSDRDPRSVPRAKGRITYNTVGGARWVEQNQEITWSFEVNESGRYKFGFRALQNVVSQKTSFRTVRIDGKVPYSEFQSYAFPYSASWQGRVLEDADSKPYAVYLEKGKHTLSLAVTHAPVEPIIAEIDSLSQALDSVDWDLRALTGAIVDRNRTWVMERDYPKIPGSLLGLADRLELLSQKSVQINGNKDSISQGFETAAKDILSILKKPEEIPYNVDEISSIREKLNLFIESLLKQPLQLDEVYITPVLAKFPSMEATVWNRAWGGVQNFGYSFNSRDSITKLDDHKLNIWVQRGRDYVDQLQQLADESFTPLTGIEVKVNLLANPELLLMSNAADVQPDIALGLTQDLPVDLAIRGSLQNLSEFEGFNKLYDQFSPGSWLPLNYNGGYYGTPETQSFQVLFYREDILNKLGIKVPQTWDEVYDILPTLQQNYMNFYINPKQFSQYFYQNGVDFYEPNGLKTALDNPDAFKSFKQWTDLFNTYAIEKEVPSFYQHFRDGTMPIGISDYNMYVQLSAAAPELNDRWKIANIPGVKQPDGTISRWAGGGQRTGVIFKRSQKKDDAWKFLQWWESADVQQQYGADLEAINGVAFRWNTANVQAFTRLPWKREDAQVILDQWRWYKDIPNVPGGYYLERELNNAWNRTVIGNTNYRASLEQAVRDINRELSRKQQEFGFIDANGSRLKELSVPVVNKPWEGIDRYVK